MFKSVEVIFFINGTTSSFFISQP